MRSSMNGLAAFAAVILLATESLLAGPPVVSLDVKLADGLPPENPGSVVKALTDAGFSSVRLQSGGGEKAGIREGKIGETKTFAVSGVLEGGNMLYLPGGKFRIGDKAGLQLWIAKLADGGEAGLAAKPLKFGLTAEYLKATHEALKQPVEESTKGEPANRVLRAITARTGLKLVIDPSAKEAIRSAEPNLDEFQGMACGTALAAALRPLGCVFVPERPLGGEIQLKIADSRTISESWPVGWSGGKSPGELAPKFFEFLNIEIKERPVSEVIEAIAGRSKLPVVFDYNNLARHRIEPTTATVSLPRQKYSYSAALRKALGQAKMKLELRADEAEQPFLWLTSSAP
jgi:hypothetical protein